MAHPSTSPRMPTEKRVTETNSSLSWSKEEREKEKCWQGTNSDSKLFLVGQWEPFDYDRTREQTLIIRWFFSLSRTGVQGYSKALREKKYIPTHPTSHTKETKTKYMYKRRTSVDWWISLSRSLLLPSNVSAVSKQKESNRIRRTRYLTIDTNISSWR